MLHTVVVSHMHHMSKYVTPFVHLSIEQLNIARRLREVENGKIIIEVYVEGQSSKRKC